MKRDSGCYDCAQVTSGDCGKHGVKMIYVPARVLMVRDAAPRAPQYACECSVASHCEKFGGCLAECDSSEITITRFGSGNQAANAERADTTRRSEAP